MRVCIFLLIINLANCSYGQNRILIEKIDPSENLATIIEELSYSMRECDYYHSSLMYLVRDLSGTDSFRLSITMIEGLEFLSEEMYGDIIGYFESDGRTVLLMGEKLKKLCSISQIKKEFIYDEDFEVYPSDYSLWIYELNDDQLIELKSYKIPCN